MIVLGMLLAVVVAAVAELGAIANKEEFRLIAIFFILGEIRFSIYKREGSCRQKMLAVAFFFLCHLPSSHSNKLEKIIYMKKMPFPSFF